MLTQKGLKKLLLFDRFTGKFFWKGTKACAGWISKGYYSITIKGKHYRSNRLAWLYEYGYLPDKIIDHINKVKTDNMISNLREVTSQVNARNTSLRKCNRTGVKGVSLVGVNRWRVRVEVSGKSYELGRFTDFTEAVAHRLFAEDCLDWHLSDANTSARQYIREYLKESNQ